MNIRKIKWAVVLGLHRILAVSSALAQIADPVVTVTGGASQQTITATVTESTAGTTLYYTTDGSNPTMSSASLASGGSVLLSQNATLNVQAFQTGTNTSNLVTTRYSYNGTVSAGNAHSLALKNDGTIWAWGNNSYGQLGTGSTGNSSTPVQVMTSGSVPLSGIVSVAAGTDQSFAVDGNGNVWAWGFNTGGQLGIGTSTNATLAVQVTGVSGIVAIASSGYHTLALKSDGTVWTWGANNLGQTGNGTTSSVTTTPTQVSTLQGIVALAAGSNHSLALDKTGKLWAWGDNSHGQLGTGTYSSQTSPVAVGSSFTGVVSVSAGTSSSYALKGDGSAWSWGDNSVGSLGNGNTTASTSPTQISSLNNGVVAIGNQAAMTTGGMFYTWGDNSSGRLGTGSVSTYSAVVQALSSLGGIGVPAAPLWAILILGVALFFVISHHLPARKRQES